MIILWSALLTAAVAHKVVDSTEDVGPEAFSNVTTLYPITNTTNTTIPDQESKEDSSNSKSDATVWKIDAKLAQPDLDTDKDNLTKIEKNVTKEFRPSQHLGSYIEVEAGPTGSSYDSFTPVKKPAFAFVSHTNEEYRPPLKTPKEVYQTHKGFPYKFESSIYTRAKHSWTERPSDSDSRPWKATPDSSEARPWKLGPGFSESRPWKPGPDSLEARPLKAGAESLEARPWKAGADSFEARPWKAGADSLESRPTVESPVKLPAGGLYKYQDPFREKPGKDHDDDFGLEFNEGGKENSVKKRGNPFEDLLRIVTAFLPVGLIISALTPSLITIENTGPDYPYSSNLPYRRSDPGPGVDLSALPIISERCRRRLLCELHSDTNYSQTSSHRVGKHCYRIRCEDPEALAKTLRWLLEYRQTHTSH